MRIFKQLFIDNKQPQNKFAYDYVTRQRIDKVTPQILNYFVRQGYELLKIENQDHQVVFLLLKAIEEREYTLELKYGDRWNYESRFLQVSTEFDNPDAKMIEEFVKNLFTQIEEGQIEEGDEQDGEDSESD